MQAYLAVFLGAGLGGALRHGVNSLALRWWGTSFPWGTLLVNVAGSCMMGILAVLFVLKMGVTQSWRLFLVTGVLGGFTTFSTFALDAVTLWERGEFSQSIGYVIGSVGSALLGLALAMAVMRFLGSAASFKA